MKLYQWIVSFIALIGGTMLYQAGYEAQIVAGILYLIVGLGFKLQNKGNI